MSMKDLSLAGVDVASLTRIDTLAYAKKLEEAGMPRSQAEGYVRTVRGLIDVLLDAGVKPEQAGLVVLVMPFFTARTAVLPRQTWLVSGGRHGPQSAQAFRPRAPDCDRTMEEHCRRKPMLGLRSSSRPVA